MRGERKSIRQELQERLDNLIMLSKAGIINQSGLEDKKELEELLNIDQNTCKTEQNKLS